MDTNQVILRSPPVGGTPSPPVGGTPSPPVGGTPSLREAAPTPMVNGT
ncbi:hypothetical protein [Anabaena sp. UHCC 0399]|nr:hypothetical protein [Anabaena sp. UHCC 0399]MEA5567570.1 hypothetical protein [Anabaena sp. UHCC 0399]